MVNPSTLATAATGAVAAAASAIADVAGDQVRRAAARPSGAPESGARPFLLDPDVIRTLGRLFGVVGGRRTTTRAGIPGWAPAPASRRSSSASKASGLSFLSDSRLTIEEKLMRLLAHLSDRWEKEMQARLDQIAADENNHAGTGTASTGAKKSGGGLLGGLAGVFSSIGGGGGGIGGAIGSIFDVLKIPGVTSVLGKIGGPVLAAAASALGFPGAAPLLLKIAPAALEVAGSVASSAGKSGSSGSGASSGTSGKKMSDSERQLLVMEIQRIYERQKEMFGLVSNILRSGHDTRMGVINNLR